MYEVTIQHTGLHAYRMVKGHTPAEAELKAKLQSAKWDEQWQRVLRQRTSQQSKTHAASLKEQAKSLAEAQNEEAEAAVAAMDTILVDGVRSARPFDWRRLKQSLNYGIAPPTPPQLLPIPEGPTRSPVHVKIPFFLQLIPSYSAKRHSEAVAREEERYQTAHGQWLSQKLAIVEANKKLIAEHEAALNRYGAAKQLYVEQAKAHNETVESQEKSYLDKQPEAVVDYCQLVLEESQYPDSFPSNFQLDYLPETRTFVVEYVLPDVEALPTVKGYKFVSTKSEIVPSPVSDAWRNKTFDSVLFQITLRTLYELIRADVADAIDSIVFNGWITSVDRAIGKETTACIVSVQAMKAEVLDINMEQVDAKTCFKKLKGVSASKLINLSPIRPILQLKREDSRFIPSHQVVNTLDESANLAAMDWEEFEHLIREVFEKEFSAHGNEVKITRASRDGGVDAVAFDSDPIRGGKIVIQAKRYTNTVSVSAVRDLYGTIMNEGANKGILVSTADYGPDAYEFAKGKPITLLNGNELLYLLQKHGHKARINLIEARMLAAEQGKAASSKA